jgi:hypothetical protein
MSPAQWEGHIPDPSTTIEYPGMTPDKAVGVDETVTYTPQKATSCLYGSTANVTLL